MNEVWIIVAALCAGIIAAVLWIFLVPRFDRWWLIPFIVTYCLTVGTTTAIAEEPVNANFRIASFAVHGGGEYNGNSWAKRIPVVVDTMLQAKASLYILQEAHEEQDEDKQILAELKRRTHSGWVLVRGDGGNHFIFDGNKYAALAAARVVRLPYQRDYAELNLRHKSTDTRFWTWNTHLIANSTSEGRPPEVAQPMRMEQAAVVAGTIDRLHRSIGGGDMNDHTYEGVRSLYAEVGHKDVRLKTTNITNGEYDSHKFHQGPTLMRGFWMDLLAAGDLTTVSSVGLIESGIASDHNLIWASVSIPK